MTRQHFIAIAEVIRVRRNNSSPRERTAIGMLAIDLAETFAEINPRFDEDRFLDACGVGS